MPDGYFRAAMELHKYRFIWPALLPLCIKHWAWVEKKIKLASFDSNFKRHVLYNLKRHVCI
jgi:hypothetical protein